MATEDDIRRAARQAWGDRFVWSNEFGSAEGKRMKDVTPASFKPTPKPKPRRVQLHENRITHGNAFEVMMPNGQYLANADGKPYCFRIKQEPTLARQEIAVEKFTHVYNKFREFWP